ncbi:DUF3962 domain-containing protein [Nostoc sp. CHAB 5784]|uniref:pPIWI_RE module domain-containing protein n=1 Tax=Nostoc mirabile TaxID=2907820 RepID=UPI001E470E8F|nr:DUF3962 domain-containing protein [Nostoc mirabile]MCC5670732.1 DUF3962 domain-containing protein [Nostoc mirabile CHAB5784]
MTKTIQKQIHSKNLPYASLRGYLEVELKNAARIESSLGFSKRALNRADSKYDPEPFVYIDGGSEQEINKTLRPILNDWITKYLKPFAEKEEVSTKIIERLEELQDKNDLLKITPLKSQVLPWIWSQETGTTQHRNQYDYRVLADYVARQIAGQEIFQGLGPMKRIISSNGTFTSGRAELITDPRSLKDTKGKFSLVLRLEVITFPSLHQPLLKVDISKRRWLTQLKSPRYNSHDNGPQEDILVGKDLKAKKRSGERLKAWEPIAKQIKERNTRP